MLLLNSWDQEMSFPRGNAGSEGRTGRMEEYMTDLDPQWSSVDAVRSANRERSLDTDDLF